MRRAVPLPATLRRSRTRVGCLGRFRTLRFRRVARQQRGEFLVEREQKRHAFGVVAPSFLCTVGGMCGVVRGIHRAVELLVRLHQVRRHRHRVVQIGERTFGVRSASASTPVISSYRRDHHYFIPESESRNSHLTCRRADDISCLKSTPLTLGSTLALGKSEERLPPTTNTFIDALTYLPKS